MRKGVDPGAGSTPFYVTGQNGEHWRSPFLWPDPIGERAGLRVSPVVGGLASGSELGGKKSPIA